MKKCYLFIISFFVFLALTANSFALSVVWDLNSLGYPGNDDGLTSEFYGFSFSGAVLINQNDTDLSGDLSIGDTFVEEMIFYLTQIQPGNGDDEGLNDKKGYEITGHVTLTGEVENITPGVTEGVYNVNYTLGSGNLDLYFDTPDFPQDPMTEVTLADGTNTSSVNTANYIDGTKIASATLISGAGGTWVIPGGGVTDPDMDQGSTNLTFKFDSLYENATSGDDLWIVNGTPWNDYPESYALFALPIAVIDDTTTSVASNKTGTLYDVTQTVGGSNTKLSLPNVPEPATMLLFGFGLLGLAGVARRKKD